VIEETKMQHTRFAEASGHPITHHETAIAGALPEFMNLSSNFEVDRENASRTLHPQEEIPDEVQEDCVEGWADSFDKLESYLGEWKH
jgi:hypothetical protein